MPTMTPELGQGCPRRTPPWYLLAVLLSLLTARKPGKAVPGGGVPRCSIKGLGLDTS